VLIDGLVIPNGTTGNQDPVPVISLMVITVVDTMLHMYLLDIQLCDMYATRKCMGYILVKLDFQQTISEMKNMHEDAWCGTVRCSSSSSRAQD
jgi:hypothetical protein